MKIRIASAALIAVLYGASAVCAEPALDEARQRAHVQKMLDIANELQLDKQQEKVFWPLYNNYQADLQKLGDKRIKLIEDAKKLQPGMTDAQATELIRRALELEETRLATKRRHVSLFLAKLSPRIVARYFQLENKMQTQVDAQIAERMPLVGE